jgi:magnesium-transporting ATPase (P-type)
MPKEVFVSQSYSRTGSKQTVSYNVTAPDGRRWENLTKKEYNKIVKTLDKERNEAKKKTEAITNIDAEVKRLQDAWAEERVARERIDALGYRLWENDSTEMYFSLREKVLEKMGFLLVEDRPKYHDPDYLKALAHMRIRVWLIPEDREEELTAALEEENERERFADKE